MVRQGYSGWSHPLYVYVLCSLLACFVYFAWYFAYSASLTNLHLGQLAVHARRLGRPLFLDSCRC